MINLLIKFVIKMQTRQSVEKMAKCGDFFSGARGNAKLMINFFGLIANFSILVATANKRLLVIKGDLNRLLDILLNC